MNAEKFRSLSASLARVEASLARGTTHTGRPFTRGDMRNLEREAAAIRRDLAKAKASA